MTEIPDDLFLCASTIGGILETLLSTGDLHVSLSVFNKACKNINYLVASINGWLSEQPSSMNVELSNEVARILGDLRTTDTFAVSTFVVDAINKQLGYTIGFRDSKCCSAIISLSVYHKILVEIKQKYNIELEHLSIIMIMPPIPVFNDWLIDGIFVEPDEEWEAAVKAVDESRELGEKDHRKNVEALKKISASMPEYEKRLERNEAKITKGCEVCRYLVSYYNQPETKGES